MNHDGIALIFSLIVIALLSVLIIELSFLARVDASIVGNWENERCAYYLAKGGVNFGIYLLKKDNPKIDCYLEDWAKPIPPLPVDDGVIELEISDEDGKVNINRLIDKNGSLNPELSRVVKRLFRIFDVDSEAFPYLVDYIDADSVVCAGGSEYESKNMLFDTKGELSEFPGLDACLDCLTIYSSGKININTAPAVVLQSLSDGIDEKIAQSIIDYRTTTPFRSAAQLGQVPGITSGILENVKKITTVKSNFFTVKSTAGVGESRRTALAVVERTKKGLDIVYWVSGI